MMTLTEYTDRLTKEFGLVGGDLAAYTIVPNANRLLATIKNRIMREGKNTADTQIGTYSTKPIYATREQFVRKSAFKPGKKAYIATSQRLLVDKKTGGFKGGKITQNVVKERMKTMYLREGYKELRSIQGLETDFVNATYSGDLMRSYVMYQDAQTAILGLNSQFQKLKREGLEKRFGVFFKGTQQELAAYKAGVNASLLRVTMNTIEGVYAEGTIA